ncbi:MAG: biotin synthase BioB [bacterium]|nr:biotin synthase BioB [bacterium]
MTPFEAAITQAMNNLPLESAHIRALLEADLDELLYHTNRIRQRYHHDYVTLCSIINARSGRCSEDCAFCAQSAHHRAQITEYALRPAAELIRLTRGADERPITHVGLVTSGRAAVRGRERTELLKAVRTLTPQLRAKLCLSLGIVDDALLRELRALGVQRLHHNLETSRRFFPQICTTHSYDERVENVRRILAHGFEACSGGLFGLGETWDDRVALATTLRELGVQSVPLNFLMAIPGTPLEHMPPLAPREILRIVALFRCILPRADVKVAGGRPLLRDLQPLIFYAGATSMMIGDYLTRPGRDVNADLQMIVDLGLRTRRPWVE